MPSIISGQRPVHVAHVRYGEPARGKPPTGMAEKPDDMWVLPLTPDEHQFGADAQHKAGERDWWKKQGIDPIATCKALYAAYEASRDTKDAAQKMESIILQTRIFRKPG